MSLELPVPNYSTMCRRQGVLTVPNLSTFNTRPRHIVIDTPGIRVYATGESQVKNHPEYQHRRRRKLHLGIDNQTKEIVAVEITSNHVQDSQRLPWLLKQIHGKVGQVSGDGAYDTKTCYQSIAQRGTKATIPPERYARQRRCENSPATLSIRDAPLRRIYQQGRNV